jgi:hypothetical protein
MKYLLDVNGLVALGFLERPGHLTSSGWVKMASKKTDGHLVQLAAASGAVLATLHRQIPKHS